MKLCVVGTGYVGLVAGTCFAESGNDVVCVDIDAEKVARLQQGIVPIYEPGLEELIKRNVAEGRLSFTTNLQSAVRQSLVCFIAVGTPPGEDGGADLAAVMRVAGGIADAMDGYRVLVDKSTVPVGTAEQVRAVVAQRTSHPFDVVSNPEFLKEGAAVEDFMKPDRVVIGSDGARAIELMKELYAPFVRTERPIVVMSAASAEMTKYAANAMLAARISLMNEFANLCEKVGADVDDVRRGVGFDRRIGHHFLFPGVGYGGSCFPKDVKAVIRTAAAHGLDFRMLRAAEEVNERQKRTLADKAKAHFGPRLDGLRFAVWGLAFKPRTDDMREAPAIMVIEELLAAGGEVHTHDPEALTEARRVFGDRVFYHRVNYDALQGADALLVVTEWNEFRRPDFERMRRLMRQPVVFDGRNIYDPNVMRQHGFAYYSVGRHPIRS
ncbi:MAG TPA: UDP-glucose/GDP-mannose dehydrogenase family protein [Candidatus Acidoferrales bacterium]|nr:UDP-glucose/GDP-mannose dehydrogenase family protein [Candidatus Acidoferrales bacterium]